jgi:hypothetical protein
MGARRLVSAVLVSLCTTCSGLALAGAPALALKTHVLSGSIGEAGSGKGQFDGPVAVAINNSTELGDPQAGDVYVADNGNMRVERFSATGSYLGQFNGTGSFEVEGKTETGAAAPTGQFAPGGPVQVSPLIPGVDLTVAVDSSSGALDPSKGDVYVLDGAHNVIDKFSPTGEYEGQLEGICGSSGTCPGSTIPFSAPYALAVDSAGDLWVGEGYEPASEGFNGYISEFSAQGSFIKRLHIVEGTKVTAKGPEKVYRGSSLSGLAVGLNGSLYGISNYGDDKINPSTGETEYNWAYANGAQGTGEHVYQEGEEHRALGLSLNPSTNDLLLVEPGGVIGEYGLEGELSSIPLATFGAGDLPGRALPEGVAANDSGMVYVTEPATNRVLFFDDAVLPDVSAEPVSHVTETGATLNALVNPAGQQVTSCEFEYTIVGGEGGWHNAAVLPCTPEASKIAPGSGELPVSVNATGLSPDTTYEFRLRVEDASGPNTDEAQSFTTYSPWSVGGDSFSGVGPGSVTLAAEIEPGGRAVEYHFEYGTSESYGSATPSVEVEHGHSAVRVHTLISGLAPDTVYHFRVVASDEEASAQEGADATFSTFPVAVEGLPDGRVLERVTPVENEEADVYLLQSWPEATQEGPVTARAFRAAADGDAVAYETAPTVGGNGLGGDGSGNAQVATRSAGGGWTQVNAQPPGLTTPEYVAFSGGIETGILTSEQPLVPGGPGRNFHRGYYAWTADGGYQPLPGEYVGGSPGGSHLLVEEESGRLYELADGDASPVGVLPEGALASASHVAGLRNGVSARNAVSADGSRVIWNSESGLYMRDMTNGETVQLDAAQGGPGSGGGEFWAASSDGSKVFFTDEERLTSDSSEAGGADLYECEMVEVAGELACELRDLTDDGGASAAVQGVLGASEDGEYVYFAAAGALASGATGQECAPAESTGCNLYVRHDGENRFVTTLSSGYHEDFPDWGGRTSSTSEVSASGSLVFMSNRSLTGYDNASPTCGSGGPGPCEEIYVYDPDGAGHIFCASCNPSDEPPPANEWGGELPTGGSGTDRMRWISEDGSRVFFDSAERLVARDGNGQEDVYEWERDGTGSCETETGCIYLLSSGSGSSSSYLLDASANGDDVFIISRDPLVPGAIQGGEYYALYDARVGGVRPVSPPACAGTGCQGVPAAPPTFATPASVTFDGVGNFSAPTPTKPAAVKSKPKPRQLSRTQRLTEALRTCRREQRRRASCQARARKRYAAKSRAIESAKGRN